MPNQNKKVIERIIARKNGVKDNYKIGLIFEGGGMRGQFSSGAAVAFHELGLTDCFDYVYGSSSGSCAAAYLVSGNIQQASKIYQDYLSGFRFIKPWKLSKIIDIDFLCDEIFRYKIPLDMKKYKSAKQLVKIYVADEEAAKGYCFTNKDNVDQYNLIKASCAVPGYYNKAVEVGGIKALDGNAAKKLPLEEAITDGCTDIFVVTTSEENERERRGSFYWFFANILMKDLHPGFKNNYVKKIKPYNECLDVVFGLKKLHRKVNLYTVSPDFVIFCGEIRKNKLREIEEMGKNKVFKAFGEKK